MRERAFTTTVIWIALAISTGLILNSVRYTELVVSPIGATQLMEQTVFASTGWQIGAGFLILVLIMAAMGSTIAIWGSPAGKKDEPTQGAARESQAR